MTHADVVIVGGGTAGCVLAARLSEDPARRVLLLEAGQDTPPGSEPADILDVYPVSYANPDYFWNGLEATPARGRPRGPYLQPRVMGGGSSVMGMWALRGTPDDYDAWARAGATGWGWNDVLPAFRRLEHDLDFAGPLHGTDGPIPVRRIPPDQWPAFATALQAVGARRGLPLRADLNGDFEDGIFPVPLANIPEGRISAAAGYLTREVRRRPNLQIHAATQALRLVSEGRAVTGVEVCSPAGPEVIQTDTVILCAGAIGTPALLMRSGIGPGRHLTEHGLPCIADLPVGRGLQNHCVLNLAMRIVPAARQAALRTYGLACARVSSKLPGAPDGDLHLQFIARTGAYPHGTRVGIVGAALYAPVSRGAVTLASADPATPPQVDFNLLADPFDRARMAIAARHALDLLSNPEVEKVRGDVFCVAPTAFVRRLNRPSLANRILSTLVAAGLDAPEPVRGAVMSGAGRLLQRLDLDDRDLDSLIDAAVPVFHPSGTCRMGAADDAEAVVDPKTRVLGVGNLYVVDASIMPLLPRANTCLPTMMLAEHAAPLIMRGS